MPEIMRIRMLAMIDTELKEVEGSISNNKVWACAASTPEEEHMFEGNIMELQEYQDFLLRLREQVVEDELEL